MNPTTGTEIAALRALAEEGRLGPLGAGPALVLVGILVPAACLGSWVAGLVPDVPRGAQVAGLVAFCAAGGLIGQIMIRKLAPAMERGTVMARAEGLVWGLGGLATGVFAAVLVLRGLLGLPTPANVIGAIATVAFLHIAVAYFVTAGLARVRWLQVPGYGALVAGLVCGLVADQPLIMPLVAGLMLLLALVPGILLLRAGRRAG